VCGCVVGLLCVCTCVCMCACACVCVRACTYASVRVCACVRVCVCACVCMCVSLCICTGVYVYYVYDLTSLHATFSHTSEISGQHYVVRQQKPANTKQWNFSRYACIIFVCIISCMHVCISILLYICVKCMYSYMCAYVHQCKNAYTCIFAGYAHSYMQICKSIF